MEVYARTWGYDYNPWTPARDYLVCVSLFQFGFGFTCGRRKFPGQGLHLHCCWDLLQSHRQAGPVTRGSTRDRVSHPIRCLSGVPRCDT